MFEFDLTHIIHKQDTWVKIKIRQLLLQKFFWPNMGIDIATLCRKCSQYQKTISNKVYPVSHIPLPVMDISFKHIGMDIL